jgi:hypothetical protein
VKTSRRLLLPVLLLAAACFAPRRPASPYLRIVHVSGRVYYADQRNLLLSSAGGFLSFYDLVTDEKVQLPNGTYTSQEVPYGEVKKAREAFMYNPSHPPTVEDLPKEAPKK